MASSGSDLRSKLSKVKGLGSAHHGVTHWWRLRLTAVALIPMTLWFVVSLLCALRTPRYMEVAEWFASPVNALLMVLLSITTFIHAKLGMEVVIEDYVKGPAAKYMLLMINTFLSFLLAAVSVLAVLKLHFLDVAASM